MKIALVIYGSLDTVSGGYLYDRRLCGYLRACGDEVEIISIPNASYGRHLLDNLSFRLPPGPDIIIEDELVHPSVQRANLCRRGSRSRPVLSLIHNLRSSERRAPWKNYGYSQVEKWHLYSVDGYIFNSAATRESVHRLVGAGRPHIIAPPGGDRLGGLGLDAIGARAARQGPLRLLFLANVTPLKGLHVLLDALDRLPPGTCSLDVAGSLAVDRRYSRAMQERGARLSSSVKFHGVLDDKPLADLLQRSEVLALPSFYEGFGIAYLEGMAFGLPAIGSTAGAIPQVITHGENGFMIRPGDSTDLANLIHRLASDRRLLATMSENAARYFAASLTWDQSAARIRAFLLDLLGQG